MRPTPRKKIRGRKRKWRMLLKHIRENYSKMYEDLYKIQKDRWDRYVMYGEGFTEFKDLK